MKCPRCQHENPQGARFCEECAIPLARICSNCGTALSATAKFCHACAHPVAAGASAPPRSPDSYTPKHLAEKILTSKAALEGERKQVTVLFADLKGSMELLADRDPEEARKLLDPVLERIVAIGASVWAAKRKTSTIPIVRAFSGDPVGTAMVSNLARPGGNITDLSFMSSDLAAKRAGVAGEHLRTRHRALADERDRHRMGAHAVAGDAAGGVGGVEGRPLS